MHCVGDLGYTICRKWFRVWRSRLGDMWKVRQRLPDGSPSVVRLDVFHGREEDDASALNGDCNVKIPIVTGELSVLEDVELR